MRRLVLLLLLIPLIALTAFGELLFEWGDDEADEDVYIAEYNGCTFEYRLNDEGEAILVGDGYHTIVMDEVARVPDELDGYKVTGIADNAFYYCDSMVYCDAKTLIIPASIGYIGTNPFRNWYSLEEIIVEDGNARFSVYDGALYDDAEQRLIAFPLAREGSLEVRDGTRSIDHAALGGDDLWGSWSTSITSVTLPDSLEEIGDYAFCMSEITEIKLPASLKTIGDNAFEYSDIESIEINEGLESVGARAFKSTYLTEVTLPDSLTYISKDAFANCEYLESINASERVLEMLKVYPEDCYIWEIDEDGGAVITGVKYLPEKDIIYIPDTLDGHAVTAIADYAFEYAENVMIYHLTTKTVVIPASVKEIGKNPFAYCDWTICEIQVSPENERYEGCDGLLYDKQSATLIAFPPGAAFRFGSWDDPLTVEVKYGTRGIATSAFGVDDEFYWGVRVHEYPINIILPESLEFIEEAAFSRAYITAIEIPSGVKTLPERAFYDANIGKIRLNEGLESIGAHAFEDTYLSEIELPASVTEIGEKAFYHSWLKKITFNEGLKSIGAQAFSHCTNLKQIKLPQSLECVSPDSFDITEPYLGYYKVESIEASDEILKMLGLEG